ncbi:hypothetical protein A3Q56_07279 [Intoshia linei]|uniref:C2H2-type domain-containing protein n=1 Tax=Intoshia linei TaxID=1819745 RepID=A0A177AUD6_9BILA|nr:hypothetical protein A3Q56_07279 [Intoshia linei]
MTNQNNSTNIETDQSMLYDLCKERHNTSFTISDILKMDEPKSITNHNSECQTKQNLLYNKIYNWMRNSCAQNYQYYMNYCQSFSNNQIFPQYYMYQGQNYWGSTNSYNSNYNEKMKNENTNFEVNLNFEKSKKCKSNNEKRYKCSYCTAAFSRSNTLKTHERIHTGEKPFQCLICARRFRQPGNLTRHENIHKKIKKYYCSLCNVGFSKEIHLQQHLERNIC